MLVGRGYVSIRPEFEGDWSRQASARGASAGKSAGTGFSKAFGAGMKGIGGLAAVAVAANLQNVVAAAAVLAPALATAGTAAGALKLGLAGVGDAMKAAFADGSADAKAAASATRAVESAQRGLANAQRSLADARVQAAERVREAQRAVADAERNLADTVDESGRRQRDAQAGVRDAERSLRDAQQEAREVQASLTDARREAIRSLEDMNQRLAESQLDEREATLRLAEAERELKAAQAKPGTTPEQLAKLQLAYDRAALNLKDQQRDTKRLADDTKKANKAGVEGSQQVLQARERIADSTATVADRQRQLARAQEDARRAGVEGAQAVADAQRDLADAQAGVTKARVDGQRQIADAERAVAEAASALADAQAAAAAQTSKLDEAMAKLAPNAKSFVNAIRGIAPAWTAMRMSVQDRLFEGLDTAVTGLAKTTIPVLQTRLTETAGIWNAMGKSAIAAIQDMTRTGMLDQILDGANRNLRAFETIPGQMVTAFGQLSVAAQPAMERLFGQLAGGMSAFADGIAKGFASGGLQQAIDTAFQVLSQFGQLLGNILGTIGQIFQAAGEAGGSIVGALSDAFGELRRVLGLPEIQAQLRTVFASVAQIVAAIVPVLGAVVQALVPLLSAIAPAIAEMATAVGPVLGQLAAQLGAALLPIVQALGPTLVQLVSTLTTALTPIISALLPVVTQVGVALLQVVQAVTPLLAPIGQLIASVVTALAPALTPVIRIVTQLVSVLVGPLTSVIEALTPALVMVADVVARVFEALEPFLAPLVTLIGQVASLLAGIFTQALSAVMAAVEPLIPVGIQLIESVLGALTPLLPIVGAALQGITAAFMQLLPPLSELWSSLMQQLMPVLDALLPIFTGLAGILAGALAAALPPLIDALMILFAAFEPIFPLIGEILGIVIELAGSVLQQLLPPLVELIKAGLDLFVALSPILPPLMQLVGLVIQLAVSVLSALLPPLVKLAGFFIGALAGALGTVIGWLAGLVSGIATLVSWVTTKLGPAFKWLNDKVIQPVWGAIKNAVKWAWENVIRPAWEKMRGWILGTLAPAFIGLKKDISFAWQVIRTVISTAWERYMRPVFSGIQHAVHLVAESFRIAKDAIGKQWEKIKGLTRGPIQWVVDVVYNQGVRGMWNSAAKVLPIKPLAEYKFADGGSVRGPGTGTSDSIPALLSNGEHVWTAREVRGVGGHGVVEALRRQAVGRFAKGGPVGAHGGIGDWFGGKIKALGGALNNAKDWVLGGVHKAASLAARPIRDLISRIPGADGGFGRLVKALPTALLNKALGAIKGTEDREVAAGGQWLKPVDVAYGTKFGVAGRMWSSGRHTGLDFPARMGTPVRAVAPGQILGVGRKGPYGTHILVQHGGGLQSLYAHLSAATREGGAVGLGQEIGRVGATGNVTGPHLHLEARLNGKPVDPMPYLTGVSSAAGAGGAGVQRWSGVVRRALGLVGQPASHAGITLRRMNQESGGDPNIVNRWDSNWRAGHPSVGLMQVIRPTFQRHAGRYRTTGPFSYGVSTNPLANVYASMRYALAQYGSLPRAYNRPGGYASGGTPRAGEWAWVGEQGPELVRFGAPSRVYSNADSTALVGAAATGGLAAGQPVTLVVQDGPTLNAYVAGVADGRVAATLRPVVTAMRANRKGV
ncbi:peptidoglycan DD-metalloendopeptidase family protein [Streptomyces lavendofoliae]|uniref:peptidoglycan DD-metalloendopeptidase family protein n=1 Tax=Streptomyces lavendofoliae TaxID=67314 RepID=UPI001677327E|nr:peptidoglycan DD-metalloendopeptidase family protein [Streptomyces lavendofoliae]